MNDMRKLIESVEKVNEAPNVVYCLLGEIQYEGENILGIFTDERQANEALAVAEEKGDQNESYSVRPIPLNQLKLNSYSAWDE